MPNTFCGGEYWEELTTEEWEDHVILVRKLFKIIVSQEGGCGHVDKHRKILISMAQDLIKRPKVSKNKKKGPPTHTSFYTKSAEAYGRLNFLIRHGKEMDEKLNELSTKESNGENLTKDDRKFVRSVSVKLPIGFGLQRSETEKPLYHYEDIRVVRFEYLYEDGAWLEHTASPDLRIQNKWYAKGNISQGAEKYGKFDIGDFFRES